MKTLFSFQPEYEAIEYMYCLVLSTNNKIFVQLYEKKLDM